MTRPLRVMTFNIHGGRPARGPCDLAATAAAIAEGAPDLCALQEVLRWPAPYLSRDQPRRLAHLLGMRAAFRPSFGLGRLGFGNALLSRQPAEEVRRRRLPGRGEPRAALIARYACEGGRIWVVNTHLSLSPRDRPRQMAALLQRAARLEGPVLLAGDWNCSPASEEVAQVVAAGFQICGPPDLPTFPSDAPAHRLDYLAVSRHFRVLQAWTVPTLASDHLPLCAELLLEA